MMRVTDFRVRPVSLVDWQNRQRVDISYCASCSGHARLTVYCGDVILVKPQEVAITSGYGTSVLMLPVRSSDQSVRWVLESLNGKEIARQESIWSSIRPWTVHVMVSSHTDIGLHNSQYIQRFNSECFLDEAMALCDQTEDWPEATRYRYIMEGTWFWNNYPADRGEAAARHVIEKYVKKGKIGIGAGIAGNFTQVYGLEEMCRSTYGRRRLMDQWGVDSRTMTMVDNNGLSWSMVQPYADAGYQHILFAPNQWNPLPSTVWKRNTRIRGYVWNTEAGGGGSRIDLRLDSDLPMVFYWQGSDEKSRILVWGCGKYEWAANTWFGIRSTMQPSEDALREMEDCMAESLPRMEEKYPFDLWLSVCYSDDQKPDIGLTACLKDWNDRWQWPRFRTVGNLDEPLDELKRRYNDVIPVLKGDLTGGWYQLPASTPELLAAKFQADRLLPTAEKLASLAGLIDTDYRYPATEISRAWEGLLFNDEHSYGASGYQGRRVYETWMQHRAWIEEATQTAQQEADGALRCIASQIRAEEESAVAFNPAMQARTEWIASPWKAGEAALAELPPMGYRAIPACEFQPMVVSKWMEKQPPVVENDFYRLRFSESGGISSIYDKQLGKELVDQRQAHGANTFLYTKDNHQSFHSPTAQEFIVEESEAFIRVTVTMEDEQSGAEIIQQVTLPRLEKRIEMDNRLNHVRDMFNRRRYYRYAYYAFPFDLEGAKRLCHLNGCVAEYGKDLTGHGTDVYMAANEWCCVQNKEMGIGLIQLDSELVEFDHIHPDKTDYGNPGRGSHIYSYLANDWLQMHVSGGDELNFRFRYAVTSYSMEEGQKTLQMMAERFGHAPVVTGIEQQEGRLPAEMSFMNGEARLLTLKRAEDGEGLIARLYGDQLEKPELANGIFGSMESKWNTADERPTDEPNASGFVALRLGKGQVRVSVREERESDPLAIGQVYTGLIQRPCAACGEDPGKMYLLWGHAPEAVQYEVYRNGEKIACVERGEYCVGRYIDEHLKNYTTYEYSVRAIDAQGVCGPMSECFTGRTRQM